MNLILAIAMLCQVNPSNTYSGMMDYITKEQTSCQKYYATCLGDTKNKTPIEIDQTLLECIKKR